MNTALKTFLTAGAFVLAAVLIVGVYQHREVAKACTMEAKICPDGSSVGRSGPNCEFAACPTAATDTSDSSTVSQPTTVEVKIGQTVKLGEISITPLAVVDDSRCPTDVQCIWAGTVHVRATLTDAMGENDVTFESGHSLPAGADFVTLTAVTPTRKAGETPKASDYRFTFQMTGTAL